MQWHLASFALLSNLARNFILIASMVLFSSSKNEKVNLNLNLNLLNLSKCKFKFKFVKYCPNSFDELNSSSALKYIRNLTRQMYPKIHGC